VKTIKFLYSNAFDATTVTSDFTTNSDFPLTNLQHVWHTRAWRTVDPPAVSTGSIKWDFGTAMSPSTFVCKYHNFPSTTLIRLQGSAYSDYHTLGFNEALTWNADILAYTEETPAAHSYRYWRLYLDDNGTSWTTYLRAGRIFHGNYFQPARNFNNSFTRKVIDPSDIGFSDGGQMYAYRRSLYRAFSYQFENISSADRTTFELMYDVVGKSLPYFIIQDSDNKNSTTYYVVNTSEWAFAHVFMDSFYNLSVEVSEAR
jgi:hypothetical protein